MATLRTKYYTMPKGPDGRRHRVWHECGISGHFMPAKAHLFDQGIQEIARMLAQPNPVLEGAEIREAPRARG